jgi:hypothetical protein
MDLFEKFNLNYNDNNSTQVAAYRMNSFQENVYLLTEFIFKI